MDESFQELGAVEVACHPGLFSSPAFSTFPQVLESLGWRIVQPDSGIREPSSPLISFNGLGMGRNSSVRRRTVLIVLEPDVTLPSVRRLVEQADVSFCASAAWTEQLGGRAFLWPQNLEVVECQTAEQGLLATLVAADKRSASPQSGYGLRRDVIRLADRLDVPIAVFGPGWEGSANERIRQGARQVVRRLRWRQPISFRESFGAPQFKPRNYFGWTPTKCEAFRVAPTTLVIENSPDYVSEKLVDAIRHGVTPIYVGPRLERFGIPASTAVSPASDPQSILEAVTTLDGADHDRIRSAGRQWILSASARKHAGPSVMKDLAHAVTQVLIASP